MTASTCATRAYFADAYQRTGNREESLDPSDHITVSHVAGEYSTPSKGNSPVATCDLDGRNRCNRCAGHVAHAGDDRNAMNCESAYVAVHQEEPVLASLHSIERKGEALPACMARTRW